MEAGVFARLEGACGAGAADLAAIGAAGPVRMVFEVVLAGGHVISFLGQRPCGAGAGARRTTSVTGRGFGGKVDLLGQTQGAPVRDIEAHLCSDQEFDRGRPGLAGSLSPAKKRRRFWAEGEEGLGPPFVGKPPDNPP